MIVDISDTGNIFNDQEVMRYDVIIGTKALETIRTYFVTNDFNIVNSSSLNYYLYLLAGIKFNVKYLKDYPRAFVIIGNDDSEYSKWFKGIDKAKEINRLTNEFKIDPENEELKKKFEAILKN